ncbi:19724_t:CDS:2, partial [Dentiscutata erythropus]
LLLVSDLKKIRAIIEKEVSENMIDNKEIDTKNFERFSKEDFENCLKKSFEKNSEQDFEQFKEEYYMNLENTQKKILMK